MSRQRNDAYVHADPDDLMGSIQQRVVIPRPDCHIWVAATDRGYGRIYLDGTAKRVHRVVWELVNGPIPEGLTIDHLCRIRACVNVAHMELVTARENIQRAWSFRATHCKRGHEFTPENTRVSQGKRKCIECERLRQHERTRRRREARTHARDT